MKKLSSKFALTTISIMMISSILAFMVTNFYYQQKLKPENDEKNTDIALEMAQFVEKSTESIDHYFTHIADVGYQLYVVSETGEEAFYGAPFREENLRERDIESVLSGDIFHGMATFPQETFVTGFFANELMNTIGVSFEKDGKTYALFMRPNIKLLFNEIHILLAWLLVATILISIVFVLISARFLAKPIEQLDRAAKEIADGNFSIDLDIDRKDELGELANSFIYMVHQLEKVDEMKSEFIGNVSHDIQTPLANIKGYTDLLQKKHISTKEKETYALIIHEEIMRLSALTKQLLLLASIDSKEAQIKRAYFSLDEQIRSVVRRNMWQMEEKGIMVSLDIQSMTVYGDENLLYNVWENLLSNAIKYNKEHGMIEVSATATESLLAITWKDTGIGMTDKVRTQIFSRFYREDTSRTRHIAGTGLGLSIVESIVLLHGGRIVIESEENEGTTIQVILPHEPMK